MAFSDNYIRTHDIDWFAIINDRLIHVASAGGSIPDRIVNHLSHDTYFVASLPEINPVNRISTVNPEFLTNRLGINSIEQAADYLSTFVGMAQKGIYSFDRTVVNDIDDDRYHLVAWPESELRFSLLSVEMIESCQILRIQSDDIHFDSPANLGIMNLIEVIERSI